MVINDGFGDIELEQVSDRQWQLTKPFTYTTDKGIEIKVPEGFLTDGASSPLRILITSFGGHYSTAAVIHDYLYVRLNAGDPHPAAPTRYDADNVLYELMHKGGVNFWVKWGIYILVRDFGGPDFKWIGVRK